MSSNLFSKNEIMQNLASSGFFVDEKTLCDLFNKCNIEAIFEDDKGQEFYDKNSIDLLIDKLSNDNVEKEKIQDIAPEEEQIEKTQQAQPIEETKPIEQIEKTQPIEQNETSKNDDIILLSETYETQELIRKFILSQINGDKVDIDVPQKNLDILAHSIAKKIAGQIHSTHIENQKELIKNDFEHALKKACELEEENNKLRLLLKECNRNLNSYKPAIFGLYKKTKPK